MDALSSQATVSGYKAVLLAADRLPKFFPMLMTAAGTVAPAKVLVHRRRRGRAAGDRHRPPPWRRRLRASTCGRWCKEQVESLGATFLELGVVGEETEGGYARELSARSSSASSRRSSGADRRDFDVVVTTALIPGRPAPMLIPQPAVERCGRARSSSTSPPRRAATAS